MFSRLVLKPVCDACRLVFVVVYTLGAKSVFRAGPRLLRMLALGVSSMRYFGY